MLNVTHIAPLASNSVFLDSRRFPNLIRLIPDNTYQLQVRNSVNVCIVVDDKASTCVLVNA